MDIKEQILRYHPVNAQEERDRTLLLRYLEQPDIFTRENQTAHFTASAWVVNAAHDKVLLLWHNIYRSWTWAGGHADGESDLLAVAMREVQEETGLHSVRPASEELLSLEILTVNGHEKRGQYVPGHLHLNCTYLLEADENESLTVKEDENSAVRWFLPEQVTEVTDEVWMRERIYPKLNAKAIRPAEKSQ